MKIDEAIELLEEIVRARSFTRSKEPTDAVKLGIEALKAIRFQRSSWRYPEDPLLPGETEE